MRSIGPVIKLFVDDTSVSLGHTNPDIRTETFTNDLAKISDWAKLLKVKFNKEQTELVNIKRDTKPTHQLTFGNYGARRKASPQTPRNHSSKQLQVVRTH